RAQEKEGQRLLTQKNYAGARQAFETGAGAFERAETSSRKQLEKRPSPVERVAVLTESTPPRPQPTVPVIAVPSVPPEPTSVPTAPPTVPSDQEKIRQVLREYERAQNTLDINLFARVYPALAGDARRSLENAWQGLKSQQLELEIRQIELNNSHAVVRAYQRLVAVPRVGSEQRDERARVFTLEKRGDSWVIVSLS
ncbi:MAG TPA: nuclear transport factor 2 family protein, partial [Thermoanaerobaculia bacterium]|nr:nuclear transport factor 2 family protein [Thermoanaerobaculia bacterium]